MAIQIVANKANDLLDEIQEFFLASSSGNGVVIDAFTASNTSGVNASYKAYITASGATVENPQKVFQIVVHGEQDLGSGLTNHFIPPGGTLHMESSAINSIYFTVSGREV